MTKPRTKQIKAPAPKVFKHTTRWAVTNFDNLVDWFPDEKAARAFGRSLYVEKKDYAAALKRKEIAVIKVDVRPAKK